MNGGQGVLEHGRDSSQVRRRNVSARRAMIGRLTFHNRQLRANELIVRAQSNEIDWLLPDVLFSDQARSLLDSNRHNVYVHATVDVQANNTYASQSCSVLKELSHSI